ncbi:tetraacyldisaccharide 4'-kinase [Litoribrevibacter albus]|uniref:Tetraacyldisaccharide 4'-kinase n=1 Tax=Litoribrevibacter albus TaxID=1473156 RepID=A0AA37W8L0_9GAMM|nr:tetraacyldisaccharide 4'-kinase [Litoribrevibacter albus]GLQ31616.1 tetraacyldisaccharide 4'-kinase [Litoribrevibacter albus]
MSSVERAWYEGAKWLTLLRPLSYLAHQFARSKRARFLASKPINYFVTHDGFEVPVVVIGNISVGGTGKTPFTIALAKHLEAKGKRVGIVSRGYGSKLKTFPYEVQSNSSPDDSGDEPLLLKQRLGCPVVISPNRVEALQEITSKYTLDVVLSDDGMQHYRMPRTLEIALVDGRRGLGNGRMLPEGPLREPVDRLASVDFVVVNSADQSFPEEFSYDWAAWFKNNSFHKMGIVPGDFYRLDSDEKEVITGETVYAVSGIGNPQRFYNTLDSLGLKYHPRPFKDHHKYELLDFVDMADQRIVMTEKDAVKCRNLDLGNAVYLSVEAELDSSLLDQIYDRLF